MNKYGPKAEEKFHKGMGEFEHGTHKSGRSSKRLLTAHKLLPLEFQKHINELQKFQIENNF